MNVIELSDKYKEKVERIAAKSWGSFFIVAHRELFDVRVLPCFTAVCDEGGILGYCYYRKCGNEYEIMAIEAVKPNVGVGSALINAVAAKAQSEDCRRVYLQTSNDNIHALRFYQRRGFVICDVRLNEFEYLRKLKPEIPLIGDNDIPIMHEIELELVGGML